jgi:2-keto-4-pentenoate hydratase/2-oxohepta-3-ene-1,7-dioic acid hydratase in catechol pathway
MKLLRFGADRLGVLAGNELIDISDLVEPSSSGRLAAWIAATAAGRAPSLDLGDDGALPRLDPASVTPTCPLPEPPKIIAAPVNYLAHQGEMKAEHTVADLGIFLKARTSVIGPAETVVLPYTDRRFDQEAELGVVIGRRARGLTPGAARGVIFGYTCLFDISMRSTEDRSTRKSFDTFTPVGPWVVTADELPDPAELRLSCWVNGNLRQDASIGDLIFDVPTLVAYASSVMTLEPGDIVATGTPAGVGPIDHGDTLVMEIPGVGRLEVSVSAEGAIRYTDRVGARLDPALAPSSASPPRPVPVETA